jgi:hypothetical protein
MVGSTTASVAIAIACLSVVLALTAPACQSLISRLRNRKDQYHELDGLYHDVDGSATSASQAAYSDVAPRLILLLVSSVATLDALAFAILTTNRIHLSLTVEQWLQFVTWLALLAQSITIFISPSSVEGIDWVSTAQYALWY